ncbi:MAG: hypothetical protein AMJ84_03715 [Acidithiobacillales bacterium SM23_46]|nr:MAG: hypothetical protein AMJ84_03715 [Acidithiobacillales bacterium SM23_46]
MQVSPVMAKATVVTFSAVLDAARIAAGQGVPFSFLRIGDRTTAIIHHPSLAYGDPNVDSYPAFPIGWRLSAGVIAAFRPKLALAFAAADVVGIITPNAKQNRIRAAAIEALTGGIRYVTTSLDMRQPHAHLDRLRLLLAGRTVLCAGMGASSWQTASSRLGAEKTYIWPLENSPSVTTWEQYDVVARWITKMTGPRMVALLGIGPWSNPLAHHVKVAGGIGLNLGHGLRHLERVIGRDA